MLEIIFSPNSERKVVQTAVQLFVFQNSVVLESFINDRETVLQILKKIKSYDYVQIGYLTRFFESALSDEDIKLPMLDILDSKDVFLILLANIDKRSIVEVLNLYFSDLHPEQQWQQWIFFCICCNKNITVPQYLQNDAPKIADTLKETPHDYSQEQIISLLILLKQFITANSTNEKVLESYQMNLHLLPKYELTYDIAFLLNKNEIFYSNSLKLCQSSPPTPVSVNALVYISHYPSQSSFGLFQILYSIFNQTQNTFYLDAFVKYVKSLISFNKEQFQQNYMKSLKDLVLDKGKTSNWRKYVAIVSFILEIGVMIDDLQLEENEKDNNWTEFRNSSLQMWRQKDEEEENTVIDAISFSLESSNTDIDNPDFNQSSGSNSSGNIDSNDFNKAMRPDQLKNVFAEFQQHMNSNDDNNSNSNNNSNSLNSTSNTSIEMYEDEIKAPDDFPSFDPIPKTKKGDDDFSNYFSESNSMGATGISSNDFEFPATFPQQKKEEDSGFGGFFDSVNENEN